MAMHWTNPDSRVELDICFEIFTHVTKFFGFKVSHTFLAARCPRRGRFPVQVVLLGLFNGQKLGSNYEALLRVKKGEPCLSLSK